MAPTGTARLLDAALDAAQRAGDAAAATRAEGEIALLDAVEATDPEAVEAAQARARGCAERLEESGADADAGGLWRRIAWFGRADDPAARPGAGRRGLRAGGAGAASPALRHRAGDGDRTARPGARRRHARVPGRPRSPDTPLLASMALDARARVARSTGDLDEAVHLLEQARAVRGLPRRARLAELAELCDVRVEQEAWAELEGPAADLVAAATQDRDPVLLAFGQRFLGLAYVETGRPVEAAELLEAALPVLREHQPGLVGPVGWALGNALLGIGQWAGARTAFATAIRRLRGRGPHPRGRPRAVARRQRRVGRRDTVAAASHFDDAVDKARDLGHRRPLRRGAAVAGGAAGRHRRPVRRARRARRAIAAGQRLAAETGADEDEFDGEVLEPHVLRQGAHLLARPRRGRRRGRAPGPGRGPGGLRLRAGAARRGRHHPRRRRPARRRRAAAASASITELHAAGLVPTRIDAAGALARALDRAGRGDEAERSGSGTAPRVTPVGSEAGSSRVRRRRGAAPASPRPGRAPRAPAP